MENLEKKMQVRKHNQMQNAQLKKAATRTKHNGTEKKGR